MKRQKPKNRLPVIPAKHTKTFQKRFNKNIPDETFRASCKKASRLIRRSPNG